MITAIACVIAFLLGGLLTFAIGLYQIYKSQNSKDNQHPDWDENSYH